ncbi:hypothetical protein [Variovorax sp. YR216]|uniref:hypothetical protein n=1 Tax=Variovorax sp. YR216 TaxID=1882828 RepID=UPI00115F7E5B|nr:hypothetical protein [Variovorax sp. YR216]
MNHVSHSSAASAASPDSRITHVAKGASPISIRPPGRNVLTFLGYSGAGYQSEAAMLANAAEVLDKHDPARTTVNIGATADGIGAVYRLARSRGFPTMGVVSSQAVESKAAWSPHVERIYVIEDSTWGGKIDGKLSPTSAAMVAVSDEIVAIGGGEIARDELMAAQAEGKRCRYIPAESNHEIARQKARKAGKPVPENFGSVLGANAWESP